MDEKPENMDEKPDRRIDDKRQARKKMICELMQDPLYVPMKEKELVMLLRVKEEERLEFKSILEELLFENRIQISKRGKYEKADEPIYKGVFISNNRGFGFVEIEGREEDLFVPENMVNGAFHQDEVMVKVLPGRRGKRQEGQIMSIVAHGITRLVGTYQKSKNYGFVVPDNTKIAEDVFIPSERSKGAVDGHKVVVELTDYGRPGKKPEGKVVEIIGHITDPGVDIMSIVRGYELPMEFSEKVMNQAQRVPERISEADMEGREDLRDWQMVTIDGEDAKDLDDAVSLTMEEENYILGVHIADVSNYVQENSALDREALDRGTSVYLVDRVIPMLPRRLSNGICSLNAGEDRLAMSCIMTISPEGVVKDYRIVESVIHVNRRMSYSVVKRILEEQEPELLEDYKDLTPMFFRMQDLSAILRAKRKERGSIDFDMPESKIILDENGVPLEIKPYEHNVATRMIEDFMLVANETVAGHMFWQEMPFVYRVHESPDPEKISKLSAMIQNFGYYMKGGKKNSAPGGEIHPKEIQKLLARISGSGEKNLITRLALRSMKQARYSTQCTGHFGLACREYCHFTSPIRRYPDLQIHRILKDEIRGRLDEKKIEHYRSILDEVAKQSSKLERRAEEAERETDKLKKAQYMKSRIGEEFEGIISGVTAYGFYVELPNTVEGMVPVNMMNGDYYHFDEDSYALIGQASGREFRLGAPVRVIVNRVDLQMKTIEFILPEKN
ncbi:MAG: ribonuclease R [Lachnospiraceae bacterium]